MAIISCPACGKRISSVATECNFCKMKFDGSVDEEKMMRDLRNQRFSKMQQLQNASFIAVLMFAAGAVLMYMGITDNDDSLNLTGRILLAGGFIGYVIARIMLFSRRRK